MKRISEYRDIFEGGLSRLNYNRPGLERLYGPVVYGITAGGKRLRPVLTLMGCDAFCGNAEAALCAALGVEMFHNFTLVHDDVMDHSDMRRGRPTVHKKWDVNTAILSGDTMLTLATQLIMDVPDDKLRSVLDTFNRMAVEVYEGQRYDTDFETRDDVTVDEYIHMITLKTGALLGGAARIGCIVGGATEAQGGCVDEFGRCLGVAFQIQDDYLDVFGDSETFGKPIGGDILNGKKTYLLLEALNRGSSDSDAMRSAMKMDNSPVKIQTVTRIYERMGIDESCRKAVASWMGRALKALKKAGLTEEGYESFRMFAEKLIGRTK